MKTLYIIRHAKSSWAEEGQPDFERPLNERGMAAAPMMAKRLHAQVSSIDYILCSPALRTRQTAAAFAEEFGWKKESIVSNESIYEAPLENLITAVAHIPDHHTSAVLFGHNYGVSLFVNYLTEDFVSMPTCSIAKISLPIESWMHLSQGIGTLVDYDYPKKEPSQ